MSGNDRMIMVEEQWCAIPGFPNYMISDYGRVWNVRFERFLTPMIDKYGYEYVCLYGHGRATNKWVARLVGLAFLSYAEDEIQINHDDGDKRYNYIGNLEWMTPRENLLHAHRTGLKYPINRQRIRIVETDEVFESITACAHSFGGHQSAISECLSGNRKTHHGYTFEYA